MNPSNPSSYSMAPYPSNLQEVHSNISTNSTNEGLNQNSLAKSSTSVDMLKASASYPTENEIKQNSVNGVPNSVCSNSIYSQTPSVNGMQYNDYTQPNYPPPQQPYQTPMSTPGYDQNGYMPHQESSPYVAPQQQPYMPPQQNPYMPPQQQPYMPPQQNPYMPYQQQNQPQQYSYNPCMPSQPQNQLRCPTCQTLLYTPQNTDLFKCPCGQVLRNPNFQAQQRQQTPSYQPQEKQKPNKDLQDTGLGIGIGIAGAALLGAMLAHR